MTTIHHKRIDTNRIDFFFYTHSLRKKGPRMKVTFSYGSYKELISKTHTPILTEGILEKLASEIQKGEIENRTIYG